MTYDKRVEVERDQGHAKDREKVVRLLAKLMARHWWKQRRSKFTDAASADRTALALVRVIG